MDGDHLTLFIEPRITHQTIKDVTGGNFINIFSGTTDPTEPVSRYNLEHLPVRVARVRMTLEAWEPVNDDDEEVESPAWLADDSASPEDLVERSELEDALQTCIQGLPEEFRAVVLMVDVEGLDYQEVSVAVGKPLGTVKSRLARARLKMRDCLRQYRELLPSVFRLDDEVVQ